MKLGSAGHPWITYHKTPLNQGTMNFIQAAFGSQGRIDRHIDIHRQVATG